MNNSDLIKKIEEKRNSKIITYITSDRPGHLNARIAGDIIPIISDTNFENNINLHKQSIQKVVTELQTVQSDQSTSANLQPENKTVQPQQIKKILPIKIDISAPWKGLLDEISYNYEPIYYSNICEKLKNIAQIK